ncbi:MAG: queuosine salvage family protein [Dehalococcoidia bacterium]
MTLGVRETTHRVVASARFVRIVPEALAGLADALRASQPALPNWNTTYHLDGEPEMVAHYLLLVDALNFCFWGDPKWSIDCRGERLDGYWALAFAVKRAIQSGVPLLDAAYLADMGLADLSQVLAGNVPIPLLDQRLKNAREVGTVLLERYDGQIANLVDEADGRAAGLVERLVSDFTSFDDRADWHGVEVRFFKRAQLLAADLVAANAVPPWSDANDLTAFADYQLPRVLRAFGVLEYAPELAVRVDDRVELSAGSDEEIEIRAATVQACEQLRDVLHQRGRLVTAADVDCLLWTAAQSGLPDDRPYHRTRTIFY